MTEEKKAPLEQASTDSTTATHQESDQTAEASAALSVINHIDLEAASQMAASAASSEQQSVQPAEADSGAVTENATTEPVKATAADASANVAPDISSNASPSASPEEQQESPASQPADGAATQESSGTADAASGVNAPAPASGGQPPLPPASPFPPTGTSGDDLPIPAAPGGQLPAPTDDDEDDDEDEQGKSMGLMDHLGELRGRIVRCCIAIAVGFFACWAVVDPIFDALVNPLLAVLPKGSHAIYTTLPEGFFTRMYIAVVAGVFVSSPVIFYQIWSFIAPGLYEEEKKYIIPIAVMSAVFFVCGGAFCYFVVFPYAFSFFVSFATEEIVAMPKVSDYLSFVLKLILAFGIIFEMPLFAFFLARMGVITATMMRKARRYAVLGIFIVAAVLTPPDVVSQLLMACPMLVLYEISIWVAAAFGRKPKKSEDEKEDGEAASGEASESSQKAKAAHPSEEA
ncbi:sec-independent protein translocase protein TatC [Desulfovibrio intestinalis]|uniref:Sec-independent protein translocase protein TatC n=2 Tax=Desulfovibrio intestinalis TaxID=58621 RepID=A0A7W8BY38_9BACT|nr:twin-arginine translocase subunit TatC [Desulfovibrio intestinalis]MBB5142076.1 sec-independent protein translocase protein TatC [Desulfovibrio intestinalis]